MGNGAGAGSGRVVKKRGRGDSPVVRGAGAVRIVRIAFERLKELTRTGDER
jgi:hypothetical protein